MLVTVLCAAPFGLNVTCVALAIRPWLVLPLFLPVLRRRCHVPISLLLGLPLRSLLGAVIMTGILSLPFLRLEWLDQKVNFIALVITGVLVYGAFSYSFSRTQLTAALGGLFARRS